MPGNYAQFSVKLGSFRGLRLTEVSIIGEVCLTLSTRVHRYIDVIQDLKDEVELCKVCSLLNLSFTIPRAAGIYLF